MDFDASVKFFNCHLQIGDPPEGSPVCATENLTPITGSSWSSIAEDTNMSPKLEIGASSSSSNGTTQKAYLSAGNGEVSGIETCPSNDTQVSTHCYSLLLSLKRQMTRLL